MKIIHKVKGVPNLKAGPDLNAIEVIGNEIKLNTRGGRYGDIYYQVVLTRDELARITKAVERAPSPPPGTCIDIHGLIKKEEKIQNDA
jgi:hypothetical protein